MTGVPSQKNSLSFVYSLSKYPNANTDASVIAIVMRTVFAVRYIRFTGYPCGAISSLYGFVNLISVTICFTYPREKGKENGSTDNEPMCWVWASIWLDRRNTSRWVLLRSRLRGKMSKNIICPTCSGFIPNGHTPGLYPGAISRKDNKTEICSQCGEDEAMEDFFRMMN